MIVNKPRLIKKKVNFEPGIRAGMVELKDLFFYQYGSDFKGKTGFTSNWIPVTFMQTKWTTSAGKWKHLRFLLIQNIHFIENRQYLSDYTQISYAIFKMFKYKNKPWQN